MTRNGESGRAGSRSRSTSRVVSDAGSRTSSRSSGGGKRRRRREDTSPGGGGSSRRHRRRREREPSGGGGTSKRQHRSSPRSRSRSSGDGSHSGRRSNRRTSSHKRHSSIGTEEPIGRLVPPGAIAGSGGSAVLDACWKPVRADPTNFDAWTHLLQCVENLDDLKAAREVFDPFLAKFPYCFGYWRKYAEMCRKHDRNDETLEVYERGVCAVPLSVDLWLGFLTFYKDHAKKTSANSSEATSRIEKLYERAIDACGLDFRSDKLWEDYVDWKKSVEDFSGAMKIYDRLIKLPLLLYSAHFDKLQVFVNSYEPHEILSQEEFDKYYKEIETKLTEKGLEIFVVDEEEAVSEADNDEQKKRVEYRKKYSDEALKLFRTSILDKRRKIHLKTENEVSKRWNFEEAVKRPYFHVKPLERSQLKNWRHYLDFEIEQNDRKRIRILFERCLVACAMYEDIWLRYARYMENVDPDETREIFKRACEIHLPHKASLHLSWAAFEEKQRNYDFAKAILIKFDLDQPGSVILQTRRLGLEVRRCLREVGARSPVVAVANNGLEDEKEQEQKPDDVKPNFSEVCKKYEGLIADNTHVPKICTFYAIKYARFHAKIRNDSRMAEKIILDAIKRDPSNCQLYMNLTQLTYERQPFVLKDAVDALQMALDSPDVNEHDKLQFSQRKLEILEDLSYDVEKIQKHYESHVKLYKNLGYTTGKKRPPSAPAASAPTEDKRLQRFPPPTATHPVNAGQQPTAVYHASPAPNAGYYDYYYAMSGGASSYGAPQTIQYAVPSASHPPQPQTYGYYVPHNVTSINAAPQ